MSTITLHTTRATGTVLTAAIYNADHSNHVDNALRLNADKLEDANLGSSVIIGDMQDDIAALETGKANTVHTHPQSDVTNLVFDLSLKASLATPAFTGTPTAPTAGIGTNTAQLATTAFVMANSGSAPHTHPISDVVGLQAALDLKAPLASPGFTGVPTAPTAAPATNTTQLATTAFVIANVGAPASHTHPISDITGLQAALDAKAPIANPTFTGVPSGPTAAPGTNTTQLATTAFVTAGLAGKANTTHTHIIADVTGLQAALDAKAPLVHTHVIADVTGLQAALDGKAATAHTHAESDITNLVSDLALKAPIASPTFTGVPAAPTATQGTSTTQLATTAFVTTGLAGKANSTHTHAESEITNLVSDLALKAPLASPALTGVPTAPTATVGTNTTQLATTAFVLANAAAPGAHTHPISDITGLQAALDLKAPLASPALTGVPTAPTATAGTNTTQIATTAFVLANASTPGAHTHPISDITGLQAALDLKAPLASPALTGTPTAPTATVGTNTTQIATTAFVLANAAAPGAHTHPISDITGLQAALDAKAPLNAPAFTGIPTAPTAAPGTNTTQIATTAYVDAGLATKANTTHSHVITDVTGLTAALAGKADTTHSHAIADVTGLQSALDLKAPLASPALTGTPTAPTATPGTNTTQLATTAFVLANASGAPLNSPAFTGTPTAPTAAVNTNTTQIATTAYVVAQGEAVTNPTMNGAAAPGTSLKFSKSDHVHPSDTAKANIASPTFTGVPAAPTATQGNNSTQLATTAYVDTGLGTKAASTHTHAESDITNLVSDLALKAPLASPALTGNPTTPNQTAGNNSTRIANTAYVDTGLGTKANTSHTHAESDVTNLVSDLALKAPLASPALTGTPTAPTATVSTNTTQIATTAFVVAQGEASTNPLINGTAAPGTSLKFSKMDHVHPVDTSRAASVHTHAESDVTNLVSDLALKAPLASPALTGTPTAPTASPATNTTQIATTAFVIANAVSTASPAFTGVPTAPTASQGNNSTQIATTAYVDTGLALKANIASPALTGVPTAPTAAVSTNTTQIATCAFVLANAGGGGAPINSPAFTGTPTAPTASPGNNSTQIATTAYVDAADALKANIASPTFTGVPAAPTATLGTNTTQLATCAFVLANVAGGVYEKLGEFTAQITMNSNYTILLTDKGKILVSSTASATLTMTVPPNSTAAFPLNSYINFWQGSATGQIIVTPGSGVNLFSRVGLKTAGGFAVGMLFKWGTDSWTVAGDLVA